MLNRKLSVIIPVYNSEDYLKRCINSVTSQSYENWELILVDDGSSDSSWEIICDYEKKDKRIIGIKQNNQGPGIARNSGILKATGDYVVFIDSDDYIDSEYFSFIISHSKENDLLFIDVARVNGDGKTLKVEKMSDCKKWSKDRILRSMLTGKIPWGGVRKVLKRSLIIDNDIFYSDLRVGEEAIFSFKSLYFSNKYDFIDEKPVYMYVQRIDSQSKYNSNDPWGGTYNTIKDYLKETGIYEKYANTLNAFNVASTIVSIDRMVSFYKNRKERNSNIKCRIKKFKKDLDKKHKIDFQNLCKKAKIFAPFLYLSIAFPIVWASKIKKAFKKELK